jgi:hypothetical protein
LNIATLVWCTFPVGTLLIVTGFVILIYLIPQAGKKHRDSECRTEFYSVRAAYWCILAGLLVVVASVISIATRYAVSVFAGGR